MGSSSVTLEDEGQFKEIVELLDISSILQKYKYRDIGKLENKTPLVDTTFKKARLSRNMIIQEVKLEKGPEVIPNIVQEKSIDVVVNESSKPTAQEHDLKTNGTEGIQNSKHLAPWSCTSCDFKAISYGKLNKHQAIHGKRTSLCHHCDKAYLNTAHLKAHVEAMHEAPKKCSICEFRASTKRNLEKHVVLKHFNESIICTKCSFKTSDGPAMINHEKRIHGSKDDWLKCAECNHKSYNKHLDIIHHKKVHQGLRTKCQLCPAKFTQSCNMLAHMKKIHKDMLVENTENVETHANFSKRYYFNTENTENV